MSIHDLTTKQKQELRNVFRRAQDNLKMENAERACVYTSSCCGLIAKAQKLHLGNIKENLAYLYFMHLFCPEEEHPDNPWMGKYYTDDDQLRRLMALQLCELSLS
jgi:hypothetical protein